MAKTLAPTKGNLMMAKNTLRLSKQGYEMLDKKRNILIREMMLLIEEAKEVEAKIEETFAAAYKALESANVIMGVSKVQNLAHSAVLENSVKPTGCAASCGIAKGHIPIFPISKSVSSVIILIFSSAILPISILV